MATETDARQALAARYVRKLIAELRLFGCTDAELRGKGIEQLLRMRRRAVSELMGAPGSAKAS